MFELVISPQFPVKNSGTENFENLECVPILGFFTDLPQGRFSLVVAMSVCLSVCLSVPLRLIVDYAQTVRVLVFCHTIDCFSRFLRIQILKDINIARMVQKYPPFLTSYCSHLQRLKVKLINYKNIS